MKIPVTALLIFAMASALAAPDFDELGSRFFRVNITQNEKPLLAASIFDDSAGNLIVKGASLASLVARTYGVQPYQVVDAPDWVYASHLYDIEAEPPPAKLVPSDSARMLQALLSDRFGLQTRRETRTVEMLVFEHDPERQQELARTTDCSDTRVAANAAQRAAAEARRAPANAAPRARLPMQSGRCLSTAGLLNALAREVGEPIHDLSGTQSLYLGAPVYFLGPRDEDPLAAATTALAESGLRLERRGVEIELVVVTAIERPVLDTVDR